LLSILTVNIGAAALDRAESLLRWLDGRDEDVFILTETSEGNGTRYLLDRLRRAGLAVLHPGDTSGDRGVAIASRIPMVDAGSAFDKVTIPGRVVAAMLDTEPATGIVGVYVPNRDRSAAKTERKQAFIASLLAAIDGLPSELRETLVIGGDYNVIGRAHRPLHAGFLPFEFGLLERLEAHGFVDAHERWSPSEQAYSWIGRTGDGYRYDYFHVGQTLAKVLADSAYLHETRTTRLTDHAAVRIAIDVSVRSSHPTVSFVRDEAMTLF
jgi:exodeoxyribonuclease-3